MQHTVMVRTWRYVTVTVLWKIFGQTRHVHRHSWFLPIQLLQTQWTTGTRYLIPNTIYYWARVKLWCPIYSKAEKKIFSTIAGCKGELRFRFSYTTFSKRFFVAITLREEAFYLWNHHYEVIVMWSFDFLWALSYRLPLGNSLLYIPYFPRYLASKMWTYIAGPPHAYRHPRWPTIRNA